MCCSSVKKAKQSYVVDQITGNLNDANKFWSAMKELVPSKGKKSKTINLVNTNGIEVEKENVSTYINEFFTNIGPNLAKKHNENWSFTGKACDTLMPDIAVDEEEVVKIAKEINISKSSTLDNISSRVLRDAILYMPSKFTKILKLCVSNQYIPVTWKIAKVTPLPKSGDLTNVSNYRPISQLPLPGKIVERIIHTQITNHLDINNILTEIQGGYRKSCSTLDTISKLTDNILRNRNMGNITMAAFIDTKKAFDCVDHSILLKKLELYGIKNKNLDLLKNYLEHRAQRVIANNCLSSSLDITCGVPQGSILGPLLFLIYINDIIQEQEKVKVLLYADDTVLYSSGKSVLDIVPFLQNGLKKYATWSAKNKLTMNEAKTKLVLFSSAIAYKKVEFNIINITVNGSKIHFVPTFKYLGVILDYELNYNAHVKDLKKRLAFKSYLLGRLKQFVPTNILLRIYKTYVIPVLDYADILYNGANSDLLILIQRLQNRCLKFCLKMPVLTSTDYVHQETNLPMLIERRNYHARILGFKRSKFPTKCVSVNRQTRANQAPLLKYHLIHCAAYERSIEVDVSRKFNKLSPVIRSIDTIAEFKREMKIILKNTIPKNAKNVYQ